MKDPHEELTIIAERRGLDFLVQLSGIGMALVKGNIEQALKLAVFFNINYARNSVGEDEISEASQAILRQTDPISLNNVLAKLAKETN